MPDPFRILVCGGRYYADQVAVFVTLDALRNRHGRIVVIEGGATGADALARAWCKKEGIEPITEPALWRRYGRAAGPIRNQKMLDDHKPQLVVAFPGDEGTADMMDKAHIAGVEVVEPVR